MYKNGEWQRANNAVNLSATGVNSSLPTIGVDSYGRYLVTWIAGTTVVSSSRYVDGQWQPEEQLATGLVSPAELTGDVGPNGDAAAAWTCDATPTICASAYDGTKGTWGTVRKQQALAGVGQPSISMDAFGNAALAYFYNTGIYTSRYNKAARDWTTGALRSTAGQGPSKPSISLRDPSGAGIVTWTTSVTSLAAHSKLLNAAPYGAPAVEASDTKVGFSAAAGTGLTGARDVATDTSGNVFVTDRQRFRFVKYDSSGVYQNAYGAAGTALGQFGALGPGGIAIDTAGRLYVADPSNNRIEIFNAASGTVVGEFGWGVQNGASALQYCTTGCAAGALPSSSDGGMIGPTSVAISNNTGAGTSLIVADTGNNRIQKFDSLTGAFQGKWGSAVPATGTVRNEASGTYPGTYAGTPNLRQPGFATDRKAMGLTGRTSGVAKTGGPVSTQRSNWSLETWVGIPAGSGTSNGMIMHNGAEGSGYGFAIEGTASAGAAGRCLMGYVDTIARMDSGYCFPTSSTFKWYHVVMTRQSNGWYNWYVNGQMTSGAFQNVTLPLVPATGTYAGIQTDVAATRSMSGQRMSDAAVYENALSQKDIDNHYYAGSNGSGRDYRDAVLTTNTIRPKSYWIMDTEPGNLSFGTIGGVAFSRGNAYVTDTTLNRIQVIDASSSTGGFLRSIGTPGSISVAGTNSSQLDGPVDVAIGNNNNTLYVADAGNDLIKMYSPTGTYLGKIDGTSPTQKRTFDTLSGIGLDLDESLWVTDLVPSVNTNNGLPLRKISAPALRIGGIPQVGKVLRATTLYPIGIGPFTFVYTWQRCDADGTNCATLTTGTTYTLVAGDLGKVIRVKAAASVAGMTGYYESSAPTEVVRDTLPVVTTGDASLLTSTTATLSAYVDQTSLVQRQQGTSNMDRRFLTELRLRLSPPHCRKTALRWSKPSQGSQLLASITTGWWQQTKTAPHTEPTRPLQQVKRRSLPAKSPLLMNLAFLPQWQWTMTITQL